MTVPGFPAQADELRFVCADHDRIMDTVEQVAASDMACHYCGGGPVAIVYRSRADKVVTACREHREIVEEMIERDGQP
jgi:hypothetical protein